MKVEFIDTTGKNITAYPDNSSDFVENSYVGQHISILYDSEHPTNARVKDGFPLSLAVVTMIGALGSIILVLSILLLRKFMERIPLNPYSQLARANALYRVKLAS